MNDAIKNLTEKYVTELTALVRRDVLESLSRNLGTPAPVAAPMLRTTGNGHAPPKFAKRTRLELEQLGQQVVRQVCDLPGLSIVDLSRRLKVRVKDLQMPLRELRGGGAHLHPRNQVRRALLPRGAAV